MGTRSITRIFGIDGEIVRIYRQFDGGPRWHGKDLAAICDVEIVNGFSSDQTWATHANGMECLAAKIVASLKTGIGGIYLYPAGVWPHDYDQEYVYSVRGIPGGPPVIEVMTWGNRPKELFKGTPSQMKAWIATFDRNGD